MPRYIFIITLLILSVTTHIRWFFIGVFSYGDWWHTTTDTMQEWTSITHIGVWRSVMDLGSVDPQLYFSPIYYMRGVIAYLPHGDYWGLLFVYLLPMVIIAPVASFYMIRHFIPDDLAAFVGSITYTFATYFLTLQTAHLTIGCAYAFAPVLLLVMIHFIQDKTKSIFILAVTSLVITISIIIEPRIFYILIIFFLPFIFFIRQLFWRFLLLGILIILMNLFWILPLLMAGTSEVSAIIGRPLFGNEYRSLRHSVTSMQPAWSWGKPMPFELQPINIIFWFIPLFVFSGLLFLPKQPRHIKAVTLFMYAVALLGIFLGKQSHEPFAGIYGWLHAHVPGFRMYRESSKFFILITITYAYLIAFTFYAISCACCVYKKSIYYTVRGGLCVILVGLFLINVVPLLNGKIGTMFVRRDIHNDYEIYQKFVGDQKEFFRVLGVPQFSRYASYTARHPKVDVVNVINNSWKKFIDPEQKTNDRYNIEKLVTANYFDYLLDVSSIKYIFVPVRDVQNDDDFFNVYGGREDPYVQQWYVDLLDHVRGLSKVDIGTEELALYENTQVKPFIRALDSIYVINDMQNLNKTYEFVHTVLARDFDIILRDEKINIPGVSVQQLFTSVRSEDISQNAIHEIVKSGKNETLYVHQNGYEMDDDVMAHLQISDESLQYSDQDAYADGNFTSRELDDTDKPMREFVYNDGKNDYDNRINNASFESGAWGDVVEDCNNYDNDAAIDMKIVSNATEGDHALEFRTKRHIACTHQNDIVVNADHEYLFAFDHQSENGEIIRYNISFDDEAKTIIDEQIFVQDNSWHTFTKRITIPSGATKMSLYIFGYSSDEKDEIITRYDNFRFVQLPHIQDRYYLVSDADKELSKPQKINFVDVNPTRKNVHIKGATKSFFLVMSEQYHEKWQAQFYNNKIDGSLERLWPFTHPDRIADEQHFAYMTFLNGWYVDIERYCDQEDRCRRNNDGSYDIELVVEFASQKWFYIGAIISESTAVILLLCLSSHFIIRKKEMQLIRESKYEK